ncbi:hypothetical protein [Deinococcus aluminii]|uniref:Yip1 domain-containing protein n=1 Tax=Deinococcus aluminii TaxID=1656885 RepID=A0ABP9XER6_9DEIO
MTLRATPEQQLYVIQSQGTPITLAVFAGYILASTVLGLTARDAAYGSLNTGLTVLAFLAGVVNATLALGLFPWVFTWLSRRLGAPSEVGEVRTITALSLVPVILLMLLSTLAGLTGPLAVLGSACALAVFVHGLALANGSSFTRALLHVLAVVGLLLLAFVVFSLLLGALLGSR